MSKIYNVEVPGAQFPCSKEYQTSPKHSGMWQRLLSNAHGSNAKCLCPGRASRLLNIRRRKDSNFHYLAKVAGTGPSHAHDCHFFSEDESRSGLQSYVEGVVVEGADNDVRVRLSRGIRIRIKSDKAEQESDLPLNPRQPSRTQRAMTLLGLLHLLWTRAKLHTWYPNMEGKRKDSILEWLLAQTAKNIKTSGMTLENVLLAPATKGTPGETRNIDVVKKAQKAKYRLVAVGALLPYDAMKHEPLNGMERLPLMRAYGMPMMYLNGNVWVDTQKSFATEIAAWKKGAKVIAIAFLSLREKSPYSEVLEVALMRVSDRLIPLDSGHEAKIEEWLRAQKRAFDKPLRFDADEKTIPDFWLNDLEDEYPMEVFGMETQDYLARKEVKIAHYQEKYASRLGWWHWNAHEDLHAKHIPSLPPATKSYTSDDLSDDASIRETT